MQADPPSATAAAVQPATQVFPVLASFASSAGRPGAPQQMVLRLDPAELGRVEIRIDRPTGAPARVALQVERPDTLLLLLRDQPQLQRALDLAGVPTADRTLHFSLAPPPSQDLAQTSGDPGGSGQPRPQPPPWRMAGPGAGPTTEGAPAPAVLRWRPAGIDITA